MSLNYIVYNFFGENFNKQVREAYNDKTFFSLLKLIKPELKITNQDAPDGKAIVTVRINSVSLIQIMTYNAWTNNNDNHNHNEAWT